MKIKTAFIMFCVIISLSLLWHQFEDAARYWYVMRHLDDVASEDLLIEKFELTVYRSDLEDRGDAPPKMLSKWYIPIRLQVVGMRKDLEDDFISILSILSKLSGLGISRLKGTEDSKANMLYYITKRKYMENIFLSHEFKRAAFEKINMTNCFGIITIFGDRVYESLIMASESLPTRKQKHCIIEEITQSLGLIADSDILQPSIMSEGIPDIDRLPMNDKILVRTLYDKRLKPGMTRDDAMPIVREIIPELIAAVKAHGEEALYQR